MNVYITNKDNEIHGFKTIKVTENQFNFDDVPKNSCENIIIEDAIEFFDNPIDFCGHCFSLLRKGGTIKIFGIDLRTACLNYVNGQIDTKNFNKLIIQNKRGALCVNDCILVIKQLGMDIDKCDLDQNAMYEIIAKRR